MSAYCYFCCQFTLFRCFVTIGIILVIAAIVLWAAFTPLFIALLKSNLMLTISEEGRLSLSSTLWSKPPADIIMKFHFFNVTNSNQVQYYGAKPNVTEVGPFSFRITENKENLKFSRNGDTVYYKNYKHYFYASNQSCPFCRENPELILPNVVALETVANMLKVKECGPTCQLIVDIGLLLMGEYPFRKLSPLNVTFYGYDDPFLSFVNSPLYEALGNIFNDGKPILPFKIPDMPNMAFFYGYNNSNDEYYVIETGKKDINSIGKIQSWAGSNTLPLSWWTTPQARMINGTSTGTFAPMHLEKNSVLPFFNSFLCRSFAAVFSEGSIYKGMKTMEFVVPEENFNTIKNENIGFRYSNLERIKYFPDWNPCSRTSRSNFFKSNENASVDCALEQNLCDQSCSGRYVGGTYLLPPGMFPLVCFPGKNEIGPFSAVISPPYFYYSPEQVTSAISGFPRFEARPATFKFTREPLSGLVLQVDVKLMVSFPMFHTNAATIATHFPDLMMPMFWIDVHGEIRDDIFKLLYSGLVLIPIYFRRVQFIALGIGVSILIACAIFYFLRPYRRRKK